MYFRILKSIQIIFYHRSQKKLDKIISGRHKKGSTNQSVFILTQESELTLKETIIIESLRLFSLKGYQNTSIDDILKKAHTSKGGFYNHFKTKDELFLAVLTEAQKIWREKVLDGIDQIEKPSEKLIGFLQNYRDRYLKNSDEIPGGCIFIGLAVEFDDQRPDFADHIRKGFLGVKDIIKRLLDQSLIAKELRNGVNTEAVTSLLFSAIVGASVIYGLDKSEANLNYSIDKLIDYLGNL